MNTSSNAKIEEKGPTAAETRKHAIRTQALDMAIKSNCGQCYDTEGKITYDAEEIVKAAKQFENFISGVTVDTPKKSETFIEGHTNNPKNPETQFKKEGW
jgi:hypothetical protein